jgi:hypothetical protein
MVAIQVDSKAKVDARHQKALALGANDEGPAGPHDPSAAGGPSRLHRTVILARKEGADPPDPGLWS